MTAALAFFLAMVLAISAGHKLIDRRRLAAATARLAGVPAPLGTPLMLSAAACETLAALGLAIPPLRMGGALVAAALWTIYALALLRHRGGPLDCGCDFVRREKPVDTVAIFRPALLAALALVIAFAPAAPMTLDAPFAAMALYALWVAASELSALPSIGSASLRRTRP